MSPPRAAATMAPILVVEDNAGTRAALASLLNFVGYTTITARSGEEALGFLQAGGSACLVILDLMLTGMDGATFRSMLLADPRLATIPVIVYSAMATSHLPNVVAHVKKSADPDYLLSLVAKACAKPPPLDAS
jgi:CheY-like chemotaxis protein